MMSHMTSKLSVNNAYFCKKKFRYYYSAYL